MDEIIMRIRRGIGVESEHSTSEHLAKFGI